MAALTNDDHAPLQVEIVTGPHGRKTELLINGEPAKNARAFVLSGSVDTVTTLTVEYVNVKATVRGLVETTAFNAENKEWRLVTIVPVPDDEDEID